MACTRFVDRRDAGRRLAPLLDAYRDRDDLVVLGLPRGGVAVAAEVAAALHAPLDAFVVKKLGVPGREEWAFGAVATGDVRVLNDDVVAMAGLGGAEVEEVSARARAAVAVADEALRGGAPLPSLAGRTVVVVDDGLATGATLRAAVHAVRALGPARVVVAVPVAAPGSVAQLLREADEVVALLQPWDFYAVGQWYDDFTQTTDDEVRALLASR